jgi:Integrase zinc binding domain
MPFIIKTDHISLKYLLEQKLTHSLQHKGLCKLLGLDYIIQYKRGEDNKAADALSRKEPIEGEGNVMAITELIPKWIDELKSSYVGDPWAMDILAQGHSGELNASKFTIHNGVIRKGTRIYVGSQRQWREKLIQTLHDTSLGGHSGILGTYQRVKKLFFWPKLREEVITSVQHC